MKLTTHSSLMGHALLLVAVMIFNNHAVALSATLTDVNPDWSSRDATAAWGVASGGRVNGLAIDRANRSVGYAASEWGGLYKTVDGGLTWSHLPGHTAMTTWDVEVDPGNSQHVYASSFHDGRTSSRAALNVSDNAGKSWNKPPTFNPPVSFCASPVARTELSGYGIAIDPDSPHHVYVGTSCGLAHSVDSGLTWTFLDPAPANPGARAVWDVVVHDNGVVDVCGSDGHRRRAAGATLWTTATTAPFIPSARCSIAVSPDEPDTLIVVAGITIYESNDGGSTWPHTYANPLPQGRIPFVEINQRSGSGYDLWFGDVTGYRGNCKTPTGPSTARRCDTSNHWVKAATNAHNDAGTVVFDPTAATDACPVFYSSDGGVYYNTKTTSPGCHDPDWEQPNVTPHGLWLWDLDGAHRPGSNEEYLYLGAQDNGAFISDDAGAGKPGWLNPYYGDVFDIRATDNHVVRTRRDPRIFVVSDLDFKNDRVINNLPGNFIDFRFLPSLDHFGDDRLVVVSDSGIHISDDIGAAPVIWRELGSATKPANACAVQASVVGDAPTFIVKAGVCNENTGGSLWRFEGTGSGSWQRINRQGNSTFGVYAVDPRRPGRILASDLAGGVFTMVLTEDGGTTWKVLTELDDLMIGSGRFIARSLTGGYVQPTLVALDAEERDIMVAGGADSGVFISEDGGESWQLVTDPLTPHESGVPHLPRPRHAYFDHEPAKGRVNIFIGTQGRGVWRVSFKKFNPQIGYAAKVLCGIQKGEQRHGVVPGEYATSVNLYNPNGDPVEFLKELALTYPPENEAAGDVMTIARERLQPGEALAVDCEDIRDEVYPDGYPSSYIEGFIAVRSEQTLKVTALYTSAEQSDGKADGQLASQRSLDIEEVSSFPIRPGRRPDLKPVDRADPDHGAYCVLDNTSDRAALKVTILNQGQADAKASVVQLSLLRQNGTVLEVVSAPTPVLVVGQEVEVNLEFSSRWLVEGDNPFRIRADVQDSLREENETNNLALGICHTIE